MDIKIFCSYAHEDKELVENLIKHLKISKLDVWYNGYILPGENREEKIVSQLEQANIILFLVSRYFMLSDDCCNMEVPRAIERRNQGKAHIIPIILSPVSWKGTPYDRLQCLPANVEPLTSYQGQKREKIFVDIANGIQAVIEALSSPSEGDALFERDNFEGAFDKYKLALDFFGGNSIFYEKKGNAAFNLENLAAAEEAYDQAIKLNPAKAKLAELWEKKTDIFYSRLDSNRTAKEKSLADLDPSPIIKAYDNAYTIMLEVYNEIEKSASSDNAEQLEVVKSFLMELIRTKGNRLAKHGYLEKALEAYEEAIKWKPMNYYQDPANKYLYLHIDKGKLLFKMKRLTEAFKAYNEVTSDTRAQKIVVDDAKKGKKEILEYLEDIERQGKEISDLPDTKEPFSRFTSR
jgi:tetratricopeptide (TPR) repeat protein